MTEKDISLEEMKFYTEVINLPSGEWVELRGMKTKEMDILANRKAMKDGEGVNIIAKACIISSSDGFDYDNALQGDRYMILINIRRITYPGNYHFQIQCPECSAKTDFNVDLSELEVKFLDGRPKTDLEFVLPRCGKKIKYHLPTGSDEKELMKIRKKHPDNLLSMALMIYSDSVEGEKFKSFDFFLNLDAYDVLSFQEELEEVNCGIETGIEIECSNCYGEFETELPITKDFFLPKKVRKQ